MLDHGVMMQRLQIAIQLCIGEFYVLRFSLTLKAMIAIIISHGWIAWHVPANGVSRALSCGRMDRHGVRLHVKPLRGLP